MLEEFKFLHNSRGLGERWGRRAASLRLRAREKAGFAQQIMLAKAHTAEAISEKWDLHQRTLVGLVDRELLKRERGILFLPRHR